LNYPQPNEDSNNKLHVLDILNEMRHQGLESAFIYSLMENCQCFVGLTGLMELWFEETDSKERNEIIADLQEALDDIQSAPQKPENRPYLRFDDLEEIKSDVIGFKQRLRVEVDRQGGISNLSRKTGIPQASLSRLFASASMPRRTTLFKIARALELPETAIGFKWIV
jgi:DNA-binding phage protein